jgi:hypothetical protein
MSSRNQRSIRNRDARVLLSEVLPYELPVPFSNAGIYRFLSRLQLKKSEGLFRARNLGAGTNAALCLIFGKKLDITKSKDGRFLDFEDPSLVGGRSTRTYAQTNPYFYGMSHRVGAKRRMALMHLRSQIDVVDFYAQHDEMILYYTSRSPYSIRHPKTQARYSVFRDPLFSERLDPSAIKQTVEQHEYDYEHVRSYFTYSRYSHIYKFYESAEFRACERKFGLLAKVDVSKCFDSIYTHSISWATHGRAQSKANIGASKETFAGSFDRLMQALNYDETNGIIIGPEVSRIFAEVILQEVDVRIESRLAARGLRHREDYDILRFVDDYFVFLKSEHLRVDVLADIAEELGAFRLHLNESKESVELTPLKSALSVAKHKMNELLRKEISWRDNHPDSVGPAPAVAPLPSIFVPAQSVILGYKSILLETGVVHAELANYALVCLEREVERILEKFLPHLEGQTTAQDLRRERDAAFTHVSNFLSSALDVAFFIYAGAVTVSHSVKLARMIMTAIKYLEVSKASSLYQAQLLTKIDREVRAQLEPSRFGRPIPIHTLVLLDCLTAMGRNHRLDQNEILTLLDSRSAKTLAVDPTALDGISALSLISHIDGDPAAAEVQTLIESWILERVSRNEVLDGEISILELNCISSPHISTSTKRAILDSYGHGSDEAIAEIADLNENWTFEWGAVDYYERLQRKRSNEVY